MENTIRTFLPLVQNVNYYANEYANLNLQTFLVKKTPSGDVTITLRDPNTGSVYTNATKVMTFPAAWFEVGRTYYMFVESINYSNDADTLANVDTFLINDVDQTVDANDAGSDLGIFTADTDSIIIGHPVKFSEIDVDLNTLSSTDVAPVFEYSMNAMDWRPFTPTDGTSGFTASGKITFDRDDLSLWGKSSGKYLIRITRSESGVIVATPIENLIKTDTNTDVPFIGLV